MNEQDRSLAQDANARALCKCGHRHEAHGAADGGCFKCTCAGFDWSPINGPAQYDAARADALEALHFLKDNDLKAEDEHDDNCQTCDAIRTIEAYLRTPAGDDWQAMCEAERRFSAKQAAEIVRLSGELSQARAQVAELQSLQVTEQTCLDKLKQERDQALSQVESARAAIEPFSKMASAMYVSGHCGGASPEDWPGKWSVCISGFDGDNFHNPSQHGGLLTVADFRKLSAALSSTERQDG